MYVECSSIVIGVNGIFLSRVVSITEAPLIDQGAVVLDRGVVDKGERVVVDTLVGVSE